MLSVVFLSVVILSIAILNVVVLSVDMSIVMVPLIDLLTMQENFLMGNLRFGLVS